MICPLASADLCCAAKRNGKSTVTNSIVMVNHLNALDFMLPFMLSDERENALWLWSPIDAPAIPVLWAAGHGRRDPCYVRAIRIHSENIHRAESRWADVWT